jgi:hypothetical protein
LITKSKEQKDKHVAVLIKEKERLHQQVATLRAQTHSAHLGGREEPGCENSTQTAKRKQLVTRQRRRDGRVLVPCSSTLNCHPDSVEAEHGCEPCINDETCSGAVSPAPTFPSDAGPKPSRAAVSDELEFQVRILRRQIGVVQGELAAERAETDGLRRANEELLLRFRAASQFREKTEKLLRKARGVTTRASISPPKISRTEVIEG